MSAETINTVREPPRIEYAAGVLRVNANTVSIASTPTATAALKVRSANAVGSTTTIQSILTP